RHTRSKRDWSSDVCSSDLEVLVLGVVGLTVDLQGDVVSLGVVDLLVTALDVPLTPGSDDGHVGGQGLEGQLKTDLVVALAGAAEIGRAACRDRALAAGGGV